MVRIYYFRMFIFTILGILFFNNFIIIWSFDSYFFINFNSAKQKKKFKEEYLIKVKPIIKRLFYYIFIDLEHLVKFPHNGVQIHNYSDFLNQSDKLIINSDYLKDPLNHIDYNILFLRYKNKLIDFVSMNSNNLPHNLVLNITEIVERIDSLALWLKLNKDNKRILKNIIKIFKHMKIIDNKIKY